MNLSTHHERSAYDYMYYLYQLREKKRFTYRFLLFTQRNKTPETSKEKYVHKEIYINLFLASICKVNPTELCRCF